jgi:hypothetical protein
MRRKAAASSCAPPSAIARIMTLVFASLMRYDRYAQSAKNQSKFT